MTAILEFYLRFRFWPFIVICMSFFIGLPTFIRIRPSAVKLSSHIVFFRAAWNASADWQWERSVCLSVCPSVKRVHCDKMEERYVRILYCMKGHLAEFSEKMNGWWEATPSTWNLGSTAPHWIEITDFEPIFAHIAWAVTRSEEFS